jgi:hypothetical protein
MWNVERLMTPEAGAQLYDVDWYSLVMCSRRETGGIGAAVGVDGLGVGVEAADVSATEWVRSAGRRVAAVPAVQPATAMAVAAAASPAINRRRGTLFTYAPI